MESDNIMNELFTKINALQNEQKELEQQKEVIDLELKEAQNKKMLKLWLDSTTVQRINKIKSEQDKIKNAFESQVKSKIKTNAIYHNFVYSPADPSYKSVFISGDFNNWGMSEMQKENNLFTFETYLLKGYEYAFCFYSQGLKLIDPNSPTANITQLKEPGKYNIITVPNDKKEYVKLYEDPNHEQLDMNKQCKAEIIGSADGTIHQLLNTLQSSEKNISDLHIFYQCKEREIAKAFSGEREARMGQNSGLIGKFNREFIGRVLNIKNDYFIVTGITPNLKEIICTPMYDNNGIKVNPVLQSQKFKDRKFPIKNMFDDMNFLSKEEGRKIKENWERDNQSKLKILYVLQNDPYNRREKMIIPYKISPFKVDMSLYDITIDTNSIKEVFNKASNCFINFEAILIGNQYPTLVPSSRIFVYTTQESKDVFQVLHIHINDTGEEIAIDSEFLEENESILDHKIFDVDISGKRLDYKLIFQNNKLATIFYSIGQDYIDEPDFTEIRFNRTTMARIIQGEYKNYLGKVEQFPQGMVVKKKDDPGLIRKKSSFGCFKEGQCDSRHFEELPGYLSFKILFNPENEELEKPIEISIPICHLSPLSIKEELEMQKKIALKETLKMQEKVQYVEDIYNYCITYIGKNNLLEEKSVDELKQILEKIEGDINWNDYLIEGENLEEKINFISNNAGMLVNSIHQVLRFKAFQKK